MTWAPHPKALPQAVPNSFAQWMNAADVDFVVTHPHGYELDPQFVGNATVEYDQMKALEDADFVYAKNWSCPGVFCGIFLIIKSLNNKRKPHP